METKLDFKKKEVQELGRIADSLEGILALLDVKKEPNTSDYPTLDKIMMIEHFIKNHDGEFNQEELLKNLPRKMKNQTYRNIMSYLLNFNRISIDSEGKVGWIYYPEKVEEDLEEEDLHYRGDKKKEGR